MAIFPLPGCSQTRATACLRRPVAYTALLTSGIGELQGLGLLGGVRVLGARVDLELLVDLAAERPLGKHAPDGALHEVLGVALDQLRRGLRAQAAREQRVVAVELDRPLLAGEAHLVRVHDHDEIARVDVAGEGRAVLAAQDVRDLGRGAAQRLGLDVGDEPRARERLLGLVGGTVVRGCGCHKRSAVFTLAPRLCQRPAAPRRPSSWPGGWPGGWPGRWLGRWPGRPARG